MLSKHQKDSQTTRRTTRHDQKGASPQGWQEASRQGWRWPSAIAALLLFGVLAVGLGLLAGCTTGASATGPAADSSATGTQATDAAADSQPAAATAAAADAAADPMADRTITDMGGRQVVVPGLGALQKIYYTGAPAEIYCFTLAPELAGGTTFQFTSQELAYLPASMASLPYLGSLSGNQQLNLEAIVSAGIQLIVSAPFGAPTASDVADANDLQQQTGIPVVLISGALNDSAATYTFLGDLLGKPDQAKVLADYCDNTLAAVNAAVGQVPDDQKVTLYYAEGPDGLQTEPTSSSHAEAFITAGANDVAVVADGSGVGMSAVSLEQVINWDPDVIIAWSADIRGGADQTIRTDSSWSSIQAVQDGRVYTMPNTPFAWCDRPPGVNRLLGIQWLANLLYPTAYDVDMVQVTEQFYSLFYHVTITDDQAKALLGNSYPANPDSAQ